MKQEIKALQKKSQKLELPADKRKELDRKIFAYGADFLDTLPDKKAFAATDDNLSTQPFSEQPAGIDRLLEYLDDEVDNKGLNSASGNNLGYIPGGSLYPSALGDYLAAITNRYAGVFHSSPGAVHIENQCIRWLCDIIGYGPKSGGNLTSGGSIANLIGLVNARDESGLKSADYEKAVIYTTQQVHHCVVKAIKFAGLADAKLQLIGMDEQFRMRPGQLRQQIEKDINEGLKPLAIFASAGTTDLGAVDPLQEIAAIAREASLWFHVDAAYGGAFLLTEEGPKKLNGIEQADSVTIDPHKGLFIPYGTGALLVKDEEKLYQSQQMSANYLQDTEAATAERSPADLSPELSKHFRGLRLWLPLQLFGIAPFRAALEEKLLLTRYFYQQIQQIPRIEVGPQPELSIFFFRYMPENGDANHFNRQLVKAIHDDGRIFLSSTHIDGTVYIRSAILHFRTHLKNIDNTLSIIKAKIDELQPVTQPAS